MNVASVIWSILSSVAQTRKSPPAIDGALDGRVGARHAAGVDDEPYEGLESRLDDLLQRLAQLGDEDARMLAEAWSQQDQQARERGWRRAKAVTERDGLTEWLDDTRDRVLSWASATQAEFRGVAGLLGRPSEGVDPRRQAVPAILDAIVALLARDDLGADEYAALWRPWSTVTTRVDEGTSDLSAVPPPEK